MRSRSHQWAAPEGQPAEAGDIARQFVVQLENRPGELAHLARALARDGRPGRCGETPGGGRVDVCGTMMVGRKPGVVEIGFCVDDEARARAAHHQTEADEAGVTD